GRAVGGFVPLAGWGCRCGCPFASTGTASTAVCASHREAALPAATAPPPPTGPAFGSSLPEGSKSLVQNAVAGSSSESTGAGTLAVPRPLVPVRSSRDLTAATP